ncbi:MAG: FlgD immunoglobulin-like domain containing protein [Candidatus Zixiibacteriota bacterium]
MKARLALLCFFLTCILWFLDSDAGNVPDFRVNDDFGMSYQGYSNIATDLEGNFVVCWYDKRNGDNDIYIQLFDRLGTRQGTNRRVNDDPIGNEQFRPSMMKDQLGKFVVAWQDYRVTGYPFNADIYGQRYNADGSAAAANTKINDDFGVETQGWQDIDADDFGNYVLVWEDNRNGNYDVYGQRYHKSGAKLGVNFRINDDAGAAYQHNPKVAVDGDGDFVVVWYDNRQGLDLIMGQRYNASGVAQNTNFLISDNLTGNKCVVPDVACDYAGNFTVVWIDYRNGNYPNNADVYGRNYWANGDSRSANYRINSDGANGSQAEVVVGMDYFGNFITAWRDDRQGNNDIFAQYFKADGNILGGNYRVNTDATTSTQSFPNVTMDGINIYYTWTDDRNGSFDVFARITEYGAPAIVISPNSFQFNAQLGGSNPASQSLLINNTGYGILNWTATDNQAWLSVTPTSGAAPTTAIVSVNIAGLAYGEYSGRITIADATGKDSSRTAVVALTITAPTLKITPGSVSVETQLGTPPPDDKYFMIENSGSGTVDWTITGKPNWLGLSQLSGAAPSAIDLIFYPDSLPGTGDYTANLSITSPQAVNSPQQFTVNLSHSTDVPMISVDPDTVHFSFAANASTIATQELVIFNTGAGTIDWLIAADAIWVTIDTEDGFGDAVVNIGIQPGILTKGEHYTTLSISDPNAYNSPKNLTVHASVTPPPPAICTSPLILNAISRSGIADFDTIDVIINNCGADGLNWTAVANQPWLSINPANGGDSTTAQVIVDATSLAAGEYTGQLTITSAQAGNSPFLLPITLNVVPVDTLSLSSGNAIPGSATEMEIALHNFVPVDSMAIALQFDDAALRVDSVTAAGRAMGKLDFSIISSQTLGATEVAIESQNESLAIPVGAGPIAYVYLTVQDSAIEGECTISPSATVCDSTLMTFAAHSLGGSIAVGAATPVYPVDSPVLPSEYKLEQNFPNPFNISTAIPYSLANSGEVSLEILNILGQQVKTIFSGNQRVGSYYATWDGDDNFGRTLGTGIYFVRLQAGGISLVSKLVLLK